MAGYRATKSGLAAETHGKVLAKYDPEAAAQCLSWISQCTGDNSFSTSGDMENFHSVLKDGILLCKLANACAKPGEIKVKANLKTPPKLAFKQMELIGLAIDAFSSMGIPSHENFQTVDLYEQVNLHQVVICIQALARKTGSFGPKEATENRRSFTQEQLKAGQNVIGLQMGTNKGANQSGMNIGNTRHIVD